MPCLARPGPWQRSAASLVLALALAGCESAPVPDQANATRVLGAPVRVATAQGDRLVLLTEQSLRRTEKRNRPSGRIMVDGSVTYSVMRYEVWLLDPATLAVQWRQTVQEYRPTGETVAPRLAGIGPDAVWWRGSESGALATRDGRARMDAGPPAPGTEPAGDFNAEWYFHDGPANGGGGRLRLPDTRAVLRARDPGGYFLLHAAPVHEARPAPLRLERIVGEGPRALWSATLPLARLHSLAATDGALVFFGSSDAGKVPGTHHDAQGSHVLVSVDMATGALVTRDIGQSLPAPPRVSAPGDVRP